MDGETIKSKLIILSDAAKYDVSCSSSGSDRKAKSSFIGNTASAGICHSFTPDGRCISLLKILLTNNCIYNCLYCANKCTNDIERAMFTPEEIALLTINFYKRNYIEGLFLSSGVYKNADYTMELLIRSLHILRVEHKFNGYIHVKTIPGASKELITKLGLLSDRMSVNIELPSSDSLKLLAPQKTKDNILTPMSHISSVLKSKYYKNRFVPAGQSTQLIVGATSETDFKIINLSQNLYNKLSLKRVFYSAYIPINSSPKLPSIQTPPLLREHRLYQADWLIRVYGFNACELLTEDDQYFDLNLDPKVQWALNNIDKFPMEINKVSFELLLRIPGIGRVSCLKILKARRLCSLNYDDLKHIGVVLKRAKYFITCNGKYAGDVKFDSFSIRNKLIPKVDLPLIQRSNFEQLSFFSSLPSISSNSGQF
ncbi:MAG: putative DNA modification/repair radical SAM protein [Oscillospiraceae bacterium]|nr:putative DNA modification/repair radical SAM protein [Oscillospiraceae bacterium]